MNKYIIIQPYFGKFPVWFDLFLYSCGKNANVNFVFYTDCMPTREQKKYKNIKFVDITYDDYCKLASEKLGIDFHPEYAYKLCDLKPFLGVIHNDLISKYEYWGYCDIDLIFGDLNILLNKMEKYDLISTHKDRCSGHFTLMRTKSKYTTACFKFWKWKKKLLLPINKGLDERDLTIVASWLLFFREPVFYRLRKIRLGFIKSAYYKITDFMLTIVQSKKVSFQDYYTTTMPDYNSKNIYNTTSGKIIDIVRGIELPYLHFLFFKKTPYSDNTEYWKGDYYQIDSSILIEGKKIEINKRGIFPATKEE